MKNLRYLIPFVLAASVLGCSGDKPKAEDPKVPPVTSGTDPAPVVVPDALKTAAYEYKGLEDPKMLTYTAQLNPELGPEDGTETAILKEIKDGNAIYNIERTGSLSLLGTDTLELSPAGVSMTASSRGVLDKPSLELPADIAVGKEWASTSNMEMGSKKFSADSTFKVVREEKVTTEAGTFDCLVITSSMKATISGSTIASENGVATTELTAYYAKGVGMVKMDATTKKPDKTTHKFTIVLKKIG